MLVIQLYPFPNGWPYIEHLVENASTAIDQSMVAQELVEAKL